MSQQKALYQWSKEVAQHLPHLSQPQARTLAAFSLGLALSRRCTLSWVAEALSGLGKPDTVERRLQRFLSNGQVDWQKCSQALVPWVWGSLKTPLFGGAAGGRDQLAGKAESDGSQPGLSRASHSPGLVVLSSGSLAPWAGGTDHPLAELGGPRDSARHSSPGRGGSGPGPQPKVAAGNPGSGVVLPGESARPGAFEVGPGSRGVFCQFGLQKGPELARSSPGLQKGGLAEVLGRGTVAGGGPPTPAAPFPPFPQPKETGTGCACGRSWPSGISSLLVGSGSAVGSGSPSMLIGCGWSWPWLLFGWSAWALG